MIKKVISLFLVFAFVTAFSFPAELADNYTVYNETDPICC